MRALVSIEGDELRLNSFLTEYMFGKTSYDSVVTQEGLLFDGTEFSPWKFDSVQAFFTQGSPERLVHYCGKNPLSQNARTLTEWFMEGGELLFRAALAVCNAITAAAEQDIALAATGASGILVDITDGSERVLFLPADLFSNSVGALSPAEYAEHHGLWVNPSLQGLSALCFLRAVIAYRLLTGEFPYPAADMTERNADILDHKFLPLELRIQNISEPLAVAINRALRLNANMVDEPGKRKKGKSNEDLTPVAEFPLTLLAEYKEQVLNPQSPDPEFSERVRSYIKFRDSQINARRKFRRNVPKIITTAVIACFLLFMTVHVHNAHQDEVTSRSLTPEQTVEAFFQGVNDKSTIQLDNISSGKKVSRYVSTVSQLYVVGKQREAYSHQNGYLSLAEWLFFTAGAEDEPNSGLYSIAAPKINGKDVDLDVVLPKKKDKAEPVAGADGEQATCHADYYLIRTEATETDEFDLVLEKVSEYYTLTYKKDRWIITDIETEETPVPLDARKFKDSYYKTLAETDYDVRTAVHRLKANYPWLPSDIMLENALKKIEAQVQNPFAG